MYQIWFTFIAMVLKGCSDSYLYAEVLKPIVEHITG